MHPEPELLHGNGISEMPAPQRCKIRITFTASTARLQLYLPQEILSVAPELQDMLMLPLILYRNPLLQPISQADVHRWLLDLTQPFQATSPTTPGTLVITAQQLSLRSEEHTSELQ